MITFAGLPIKVTDAVFADHLKVERTAIFIGRDVYPMFAVWARNPKAPDLISEIVRESLRTKRSVQVTELLRRG